MATAAAAVIGGSGYVYLSREIEVPHAWVISISALIAIYGYFAEDMKLPAPPFAITVVGAFVWLSAAVGSMALHLNK